MRTILATALCTLCLGCLGRGGLHGELKQFNLTSVGNRWAREGMFLGLQVLWVYRVCTVLDLFIFNSVEFWSGTNPITGKNALAEVPRSEVEKIGFREIDGARVALLSDDAAKLQLDFRNGDRMTFDVVRRDADYTISYQGRVFFQGTIGPAGSARP